MDAFATLGLPRELALDACRVRERMQAMGKIHHPDAGGSAAAYQEIVEAAAILSVPSRRLRHWAELQGWQRATSLVAMDPAAGAMFARVATVVARAREAASAYQQAGSAIARAVAERKKMLVQQELADVLESIAADLDAAGQEEKSLANGAAGIDAVVALADRFAYLTKWQAEAREALARLV